MFLFFNKYKYLMILTLLLTCVVGSRSYAMIELTEKEKAVNEFIRNGFLPTIPISNNKEDMKKILVARFGSIISMKTEVVSDKRRHRLKNEESYFTFDGIVIKTVRPIADGLWTWITHIRLTSSKYKLKFGLNIGSSKKNFIKNLGVSWASKNKQILSYSTTNVSTGDVVIEFNQMDKAKKITWDFYAD